MAVDYAKKQPPKRKSAPKRKKTPAPKPRGGAVRVTTERAVSRRRLAITIIVVVAFVALLVMLRQHQSRVPEAPRPERVQQEEPLPELPEERWRYHEELQTREVEVVVPERAASQPRLIQCASFRNEQDAESMRAQIAFLGLEAQVRATQGTSGMWYRVILGPFENQRAAQRTNHQLQRGGIYRCEIWNWTE